MLLKLNADQQSAVDCDTHCLVIAPPGSGKTGMLAEKAAARLKNKQRVAAVTFTRESALELRHRILKLAGEDAKPRVLVGTYHAIDLFMAYPSSATSGIGKAILQDMRSPFKSKWKIVSAGSRISYLLHAMRHAGMEGDLQEISGLIEKIKSGTLHLEAQGERVQVLFQEYSHALKRAGEIDFQDILLNTNEALRSGELSPLPVDYLLLDEFQDTDPTQLEWAMFHRHQAKITAVGDDDQSIYGFRNAMGIEGMNEFIAECQPLEVRLSNNYRSRPEIIKHASTLIAHNNYIAPGTSYNIGRKEKHIIPNHVAGATVIWEYLRTDSEEAGTVCDYAQKAQDRGQSMAVIARTNRLLETIESYFIAAKIPYVLEKGSLLKTGEFETFRALIQQTYNPSASGFRLILMWVKLPTDEIDLIVSSCGFEIQKFNANTAKERGIADDSLTILRELKRKVNEWMMAASNNYYSLISDGIVGYLDKYLEKGKSIKRVKACAKIYDPAKTKLSVMDHIKWVETLLKPKQTDDKPEDQTACVLLSAHGSKGLEFDNVWIIGANKEVFPNTNESSMLAEERRLFFVAMTRAKKHLIITASGENGYSQFLDETGIQRARNNEYFSALALNGPPN